MNGTLNFALSLEAARFATGANGAIAALARMVSVTSAFHAAWSQTTSVIERGGRLFDQSIRTGASVEALYKLEEAFKQIGVEAGSASPMILKLQRAIGSAEGQQALAMLGLGGQRLAGMDAAAQIEAVATALGRMDANSQANAAYQLMGREGAANMLQIARSGGDLSEAMRDVARDAEVWGRNAARFDRLGDAITALKSHLQTLFAQAAGWVLDWVEIFKKAIVDGRMGELLAAMFEAGMERLTSVFSTMAVELARVLANTIGSAELWQGIVEVAVGAFARIGNEIRKVANDMGLGLAYILSGGSDAAAEGAARKSQEFRDRLDRESADAPGVARDGAERIARVVGGAGIGDAWRRISSAATTGGPAQAALDALIRSLNVPVDAARRGGGNPGNGLGGGWTPQVTNLEKMGFIFDGAGNGTQDYARRTAKATEKIADKLSQPLKVAGDFGAVIVNE